jgi:hypothetical protein
MSDQYGPLPASLVGQRVTYRDVAFWGRMTGTVVEHHDEQWADVLWDGKPSDIRQPQPVREWVPNLRPWPEQQWPDVGLCLVCHKRARSPLSVDGTRCLDCQDAAWHYA